MFYFEMLIYTLSRNIKVGIGICLGSYRTRPELLFVTTQNASRISLLLFLVYTGIENYF